MSEPARAQGTKFTYGDYCGWPDDERWELIDGVPFDMAAAPNRPHQGILGKLYLQIGNYLQDKPCEVYMAPFDVRLPDRADQTDAAVPTVVQPDLSVICDPDKLDLPGCRGAPDWLIEILSPSTAKKDMREKLLLYERHRVKEYWVVHPDERLIEVFVLDDANRYGRPAAYGPEDRITPSIFEDLSIEVEAVFRE